MTGWSLVRTRARTADTAIGMLAVLLAAGCLIPLFANLSWARPAVAVVVVVAGVGMICRAIAMPLPLVPIAEALGMVLTITAIFAGDAAYARFLPTTESWDVIRALVQVGMQDASTFAAPVPALTGMVLLAAGGVGLVTLCVDTLFVSIRAPLLGGLPLLALFLAPAVMLIDGAPWWSFPLPAVGWLLILAADQRDRVRMWAGMGPRSRVRGLSGVARGIGAVAIIVAMATAVLIPVRAVTPPRTGDGSGLGSPVSGSVILDPLVSMRRSLIQSNDSEVLTYRTDSPRPSYLRVSALESFDGTTWRQREGIESGRDTGWALPGAVQGDAAGTPRTYDITVTSLGNAFLPLPYPVADVADIRGLGRDWRLDPTTGIAFSDGHPATGLAYRVAALESDIQPGDLRGAPLALGTLWPQLNLPGGLSPEIKATALDVTTEADTPYDKALALQRWFTRDGGFEYSTSVRSGADADYMAEFLADRVGYCEQFASAMAIMARTLGIPSRVVVGFTQGSRGDDGAWRVTVRDAHAWPELWFDGVGWARFEPTPRSEGNVQTPDYARTQALDEQLRSGDENRGVLDEEGFDPVTGIDRGGAGPSPLSVAGLVLAVALLLALAWSPVRRLARRWRRLHARRYVDAVDGAWAEIGDTAVDLGQPWSAFRTPRQAADRLARGMDPQAAAALSRIRAEVEQVRYAAPVGTGQGQLDERADAVRSDVRVVRAELARRVRWSVRLIAYCWPPSDRRRQRSSIRSMKPGALLGLGSAGPSVGADSSAGAAPKAE